MGFFLRGSSLRSGVSQTVQTIDQSGMGSKGWEMVNVNTNVFGKVEGGLLKRKKKGLCL